MKEQMESFQKRLKEMTDFLTNVQYNSFFLDEDTFSCLFVPLIMILL